MLHSASSCCKYVRFWFWFDSNNSKIVTIMIMMMMIRWSKTLQAKYQIWIVNRLGVDEKHKCRGLACLPVSSIIKLTFKTISIVNYTLASGCSKFGMHDNHKIVPGCKHWARAQCWTQYLIRLQNTMSYVQFCSETAYTFIGSQTTRTSTITERRQHVVGKKRPLRHTHETK